MTEEEVKQLIKNYNAGICTQAEKALLENWLETYNEHEIDLSESEIESIGNEIYQQLANGGSGSHKIRLWRVIAATAAVALIGASSLILYQNREKASPVETRAHDILPGGNKATVTFADGKIIQLSNSKSGVKIDGDQIIYNDGTAISETENYKSSGIASISTPKGGQYHVVLSDGTKVWLNAATTLQYPTVFTNDGARTVKLVAGEAYFEVFKNRKKPFIVSMGHQEVLVLGTHFNINAYKPDTIRTTLLEGSVKVASNSSQNKKNSTVLAPGEQSINTARSIEVHKVNTNLETAWKNGKIQFVRADLKSVMEMISRWYNIDVIYHYYPTGSKFTGSFSRSKNITEILDLLETTGDVHFKIEGRKVVTMK